MILGNMIGSFLHDEERQHFRGHVGDLSLMARVSHLSTTVENATIVTLECANCDTQMRH